MKGNKTVSKNALIHKAFDNINSAVGAELNEIVNIIEQHGKKEKSKPNKDSKVVVMGKAKNRARFAVAK